MGVRILVENSFTGEERELELDENKTFKDALRDIVPRDVEDFTVLDMDGNDVSNMRVKDFNGKKVMITAKIVRGG